MGDEIHVQGRPELPPPYALILVCFIPAPRDLEIARVLGWYRIPLKFAPKVVQVDYLAFFQPGGFDDRNTPRIETYAEVRGVELVTRRELMRDEPHHPRANEEYYKIQLGPLQNLPKPILTGKWKRMTFLYTSGELFSRAGIINDLVVRTEERKILWHSLREKAAGSGEYHQGELDGFSLDEDTLMVLIGLSQLGEEADWLDTI